MALTKAQKIQITAALIVGFMTVFAITYITSLSGSTMKVAENNMFRITIPDEESECSTCLKEFNVTFKGKAINKAVQEQMGINTSTLSSIQITNNISKNLLKVVLKDGEGNVLAIPMKLEMLTEFRKMNPETRMYLKSYEWAEFPYQARDFYMTKDKPAQFRVQASIPEGVLVYGTIVFTFENVSLEIDPAWWVGLGSEAWLIVTNTTTELLRFKVNQNSNRSYSADLNISNCFFNATNDADNSTYNKSLHTSACSYKIEENKSNYLRFGIEQTNQTLEIFPTAVVNDTGNSVLFNVTDASYYSFTPASWPGSFGNTTVYSWNLTSSVAGNDTFEINVTGISNVTRVCMGRYCNVRNPSYWSEMLKDYKDSSLLLYISGEYYTGTHYTDLGDMDRNALATNMNLGFDNCTGNCSGWTSSGKYGRGINFDSKDDYVNIGGISANYKEMTVEAWVYPRSFNGMMSVITLEGDGFVAIQTNSANFRVGYRRGAGCDYREEAAGDLSLNQWNHVAVTYSNNTNGRFVMYRNGNIGYNVSEDGLICNVQNIGYLGHQAGWGRYWNGTIDEIRVYNRVLSPSEINDSMNHGMDRLMYSAAFNQTMNQNVTLVVVNGTVDIRNRGMNQPYGAGPYVAGMGALMIAYYIYRRRRS